MQRYNIPVRFLYRKQIIGRMSGRFRRDEFVVYEGRTKLAFQKTAGGDRKEMGKA